MDSISDRIVDRELSDSSDGKKERIIGKRLREGYAHYKRYLEILGAISKHGFGYMFDRVKSARVLPKLEGTREDLKQHSEAVRLRLLFQDLGPTFIKIGQLLSTRPDLVPSEYVKELEKLTDKVKPMEFPVVKKIVEEVLGKSIDNYFKKFEEKPVGSASIGQVHRAFLMNGRTVALKVQRPGVKKKIRADLEILEDLSDVFGQLLGIGEVMDPLELVEEFKRHLTRELDYTVEARSIDHFRRDFKGVPDVVIPGVYWDLTRKRLLVMDFIKGIPVDETEKIKKSGIDPSKIAVSLGTAIARMIFVKGYFHGDPHGGNVLVQQDGRIALLDFGSVGYIDDRMRDKIRLFYFSMVKENVSKASEIFLDICGVSEIKINRPALEQDIREFLDYQRLAREGVKIEDGMNQQLISIALKHRFAPPPQFILLERAMAEAEGIARNLSSDFDLNRMLMPVLSEMIQDKIQKAADPIGAIQTASEYRQLVQKGPRKINSILDQLESGELAVKVNSEDIRQIRADVWRIFGISIISVFAMALLFLITIMGLSLETPFMNLGIGIFPILFIWLVCVWWLLRRWKGPKLIKYQ